MDLAILLIQLAFKTASVLKIDDTAHNMAVS